MYENEKLEILSSDNAEDLKKMFEIWVKKITPVEISHRYFSYDNGRYNLAIFYFL